MGEWATGQEDVRATRRRDDEMTRGRDDEREEERGGKARATAEEAVAVLVELLQDNTRENKTHKETKAEKESMD